jgi:hypothetical protein
VRDGKGGLNVMGKKRIKKKTQKAKPTTPQVKSNKEGKPVKRVQCVECPKDRRLIPLGTCTKCSHHDRYICNFSTDPFRIKVVSTNEPMKYNRITFAMSSSNVQDDARNYYFLTSIMQPTKHISDCEEYTKLKSMLLNGDLGSDREDEPRYVTDIKGIMFLEECNTDEGVCFYNSDRMYREVDEFDTSEAQWRVLFYLYDMYSLDGLADIKIDDRFYKVKSKPLETMPPSLVIAINGKNIVIGS